jgi:RNA polymerase sigma-70 factor (ECF subfamily)
MAADAEAIQTTLAAHPDQAGFEDLLRPLLGHAFRLAHAILRDPHEAEDVVQEAALIAWRKFHSFEDRGGGLRPWFLKIVTNTCRSRMRTRWWRGRRHPEIEKEVAGSVQFAEAVALRADLARAFGRLTWDQRSALFLYYQLDLPQADVARILGVRVGTVKSRLYRAVSALRSAMDEE